MGMQTIVSLTPHDLKRGSLNLVKHEVGELKKEYFESNNKHI